MGRPKFVAEVEFAGNDKYKKSPGMYGGAIIEMPKFKTPISPKENALMVIKDKVKPLWIPNQRQDFNAIQPMIMPDAEVRVSGGLDWFGVEWVAQPEIGASMVDHTKGCLLEDITQWEDKIVWPDLGKLDWAENAKYLKTFYDEERLTYCVVVNGLFERLISIISFEEALIALMLEPDAVCGFFSKLTDWYLDLFEVLKKYYDVDVLCFHDDWGSQNAPLFSADCLTGTILPYIQKLTKGVHDMGMYFDLHSCGKVEQFVPHMIEADIDIWEGQEINDKPAIKEKHGSQLVLMDALKFKADDAADPIERIHEYVDTLAPDGGSIIRLGAPDAQKEIEYTKELYRYSRTVYCG